MPRRKVRTHRFRGVKYAIDVDDPIHGWCDIPDGKPELESLAIRMPNGLAYGSSKKARMDLDTLIHECSHASNWKLTEGDVSTIAGDISGLLWRLGYRRTH